MQICNIYPAISLRPPAVGRFRPEISSKNRLQKNMCNSHCRKCCTPLDRGEGPSVWERDRHNILVRWPIGFFLQHFICMHFFPSYCVLLQPTYNRNNSGLGIGYGRAGNFLLFFSLCLPLVANEPRIFFLSFSHSDAYTKTIKKISILKYGSSSLSDPTIYYNTAFQ